MLRLFLRYDSTKSCLDLHKDTLNGISIWEVLTGTFSFWGLIEWAKVLIAREPGQACF